MKSTRRTRLAARQLLRLCLINGELDTDRVRGVVRRIAASKRRGALAVLSDLQRLVRLERAQHTAIVESATDLADDVRQEVLAGLTRHYGSGLETTFRQNPDLIGGMRIKVGSDVYDGSIRRKLETLEMRL